MRSHPPARNARASQKVGQEGHSQRWLNRHMWMRRQRGKARSPTGPSGRQGSGWALVGRGSKLRHRLGLRPFRSLNDFELDAVALIQRAKTASVDRGVMHEYIRPIILGNETVALLIVEPFDGTSCHVDFPPDMGEYDAVSAARR